MGHLWKEPVRLPQFWKFCLNFIKICGPISLTILVVYLKTPQGETRLWVSYGLFVAAGLTVAAEGVLQFVGYRNRPEKKAVDSILEVIGHGVWKNGGGVKKLEGPPHQHRITLFQLKPLRLQWLRKRTHKLVLRTRVPKEGRDPKRTFLVDHHVSEQCEGVAGKAFAERWALERGLPDLHGCEGTTEDERKAVFEEYAKKTNDCVANVEREQYYARTIGAVAIHIGGRRWGVIVWDSRDPIALEERDLSAHKPIRQLLGLLTALLRKEAA